MTAASGHKNRSKRSSALSCVFLKALQVASRGFDGLRFSSLVHNERSRMAKGMSPLRLFMRNPTRKPVPEGTDGATSSVDGTAAGSQSRQPLGPITETTRNPLIPVAEHTVGDPSTPRAKAKISSHGQEKFPHLENSEVFATAGNVTPDKIVNLSSKSKFTWQHRHGFSAHNTAKDGPLDLSTPPRPPKGSAFSDGQAANNLDTSQSLSSNLRGCGTGGGSVHSTPKTGRSVGGKSNTESDNGGSQSQNATPSKSVSRSLKYAQQGSTSNSGASGLTNVRSTASQHVITRPMAYLQAVKGGPPQITNQNFVEHRYELEEDASFWRDHNVQVIIRTRPISSSELAAQGSNRCLKQESPRTVSWLGQPESRFTFDHVAGETVTQAKLFDVAGLPMVENCMSGYNSCMFAYGQTGSGKTHTMLGDIEHLDRNPSENRGMTPRVFEYLFGRIRAEQEFRRQEHLKFYCKCSFLEIYNEQITDLLEPSSTNLQMREDAKKGVYVENLSEVEVQCVQDVIQLLLQGAANRKVAATNMNRESSRSHSVFTCVVESKWENNSMTNSRYGRLHLVDLAGSERQKASGAEGGRLKEAANINKSLSTLGLVIMILVDVANGKPRHVPYRDSKLTFLLQDSLGGNSKTIMIANVSPSSCCGMETLSTLKFAQRAKFIRNNAVINEDASGDVIALRQQIEDLKVEVERLRRDRILRMSASRVFELEHGSTAARKSSDNLDASTVECTVTESSGLDSPNVNKLQTTSIANTDKHLRSIEAVLAGALRREQQAEDITKKLAAEIEQLNRLVRQREEDSQCSKMMLRFREEKIRRLEGIADNVLSAESFYEDERRNLTDELQLIRGRLDRNPELTRFAMENIRLMEELRRYQEFYDGGERDIMLGEIAGLRSQLADMLDTKLGEQQIFGKLSTPQKRALAPELNTLERENELLLVEVKSYQDELKECRKNLNSCLVANADLARQVDELQDTVKQLQKDRSEKGKCSKETLVCPDELPNNCASVAATPRPPPQETPFSANVQVEAEDMTLEQKQALTNVEKQVSELKSQLKEAQDLIDQLSAEVPQAKMVSAVDALHNKDVSDCRRVNEAEDYAVVRQGIQDRWEKLQEVEMRHSEEISQLQLELDAMEDVLKEEREQRSIAEEKIGDLSNQLTVAVSKSEQSEGLAEEGLEEERHQRLAAERKRDELSSKLTAATSKLEEAQCLVDALEGQQLFSLNELENLQSEHTMLLNKIKQQEEEGQYHKKFQNENNVNDPTVTILEQKLLRARRGKEEARRINRQFQQEKASRMALEKEREVTMSEVETQAALAITTLQSEILELREEVSLAAESEATSRLQIAHLQKEIESLQETIGQVEDNNRLLSEQSNEYGNLVDEKDAQLRGLEEQWESATSKLIDHLTDGDRALTEAAREMEEIKQGKVNEISQLDENHIGENRAASVYHRLHNVHLMVKETEDEVRTLRGATATGGETTFNSEDGEALIRESEKKATVAFVLVGEVLERIENLKAAQLRLLHENQQAYSKEITKNLEAAALQEQLEELRRQFGDIHDEHQLLVGKHENLRREYDSRSLDLGTAYEVIAENGRMEKEVEEFRRALAEKDAEKEDLRQQLNEIHNQSKMIADRYQQLIAAHGSLQQELKGCIEDKALKAEEGEQLIRLSERKAMAVLLVVEQLLDSRKDLQVANIGLAKEIQEGKEHLAEEQKAFAILQQQVEHEAHQHQDIADQYQLLAEAQANLEQKHGALLAENDSRTEESEIMVKSSEKKAIVAFVLLDQLLEKTRELKASNTAQAIQIKDARQALAERNTEFTASQNELSDHASRHLDLTESNENLRQSHERLVQENVLTAQNAERTIRLSEKKAIAALVTLRQIVDGKTNTKAETERLEREIQEAHVALAENCTELMALREKLEQSNSKCMAFADQHQLLVSDHDALKEEQERLLAELGKAREEQERLHKELEKAREEQDRLNPELQKARKEFESVQADLATAQDEHDSYIRGSELRIEDREQTIKVLEKKTMGSVVIVEHLVGKLEVLKVCGQNFEKEIRENRFASVEKDANLAALQGQLEESQASQKEVFDRHELLAGRYENLKNEHVACVGANDQLKKQVEVLELELEGYLAKVTVLYAMTVATEHQCTEVWAQAQNIATKWHSVYNMKVGEGVEFMTLMSDQVDGLWHQLSLVEAEVHDFGSFERELSACRSNVLLLEEENGGNISAVDSAQKEISRLATSLDRKERDFQSTLEKMVASWKNWDEEREVLVSENKLTSRQCLEKEELAQSLRLEVQKLDLTVKNTELRLSDTLTAVHDSTVAKGQLELENSRLVLAARQAERKCSEKELEITAIQSRLASVEAILSAAEMQEQSRSGEMEGVTAAALECEIERVVVEHQMQEMEADRHRLLLQVNDLKSELDDRERAILESVRRSQDTFESIEGRMTALDEELAVLEMYEGNLDHDMAILESSALGALSAWEEKELECVDIRRQLGIAGVQITQMQTAVDLLTAQLVMEKSNSEADKWKVEEERRLCEAQLQKEIFTAELMFLSTEEGLKCEVERLDLSLKQTELRVSEMISGVQALTVAKDELDLEKSRLVFAARQAEMKCRDKEEEISAIEADLAGVRARLMEAELRENSISREIENLARAKVQWEVEGVVAKRDVDEMRQGHEKLRHDLHCLNVEVEERETALFDSFRRSQEAFERVEVRLTNLDPELRWLDSSAGNLEQSVALLDSVAIRTVVALEEDESKYLEMQRHVESAEVQMSELQSATDIIIARFVGEREDWEAEKNSITQKKEARETELGKEIAAAELRLVATERSLETAVENVESLAFRKQVLEEEIFRLNDNAERSLSKLAEQQQEIDTLKGITTALKAECTEADDKIDALNQLREQYVLAEATWRAEKELLTGKVQDLEVRVGRKKTEEGTQELPCASEEEGLRASECTPLSEEQKPLENFEQLDKQDNRVLRAKLSEKDSTIFSAKREMQIAIANLKEAELEMDKVHRLNHSFTQMQLEDKRLIDTLSFELKSVEDQLLKRNAKIEGCEAELQKVAGIMSDWESNMQDVENEWRREKEALAQELTEAKLVANEKRNEAAALLQKFQDGQAILKEAEDVVDAFIKASENAKHGTLERQIENERIVQGWWIPERNKLVAEIARLETDMSTQNHGIWTKCTGAVNGLVETMDAVSVADQELHELKRDHEQEMQHLLEDVKIVKDDLVAGLQFLVDFRLDIETYVSADREKTSEVKKLKITTRCLEPQLEEKDHGCMSDQLVQSKANPHPVAEEKYLIRPNGETVDEQRRMASSEAQRGSVGTNLEESSVTAEKEESLNSMHRELEQSRSELARIKGTVCHLESQVKTQTDALRDYDSKLRCADQVNAELLAKYNDGVMQWEDERVACETRLMEESLKQNSIGELLDETRNAKDASLLENVKLQRSLTVAEHSSATTSSDLMALSSVVTAEGLLVDQLQMDFASLADCTEELKNLTLVVLMNELRTDHEEMRDIAYQMSTCRDEIFELGKLSRKMVDAEQRNSAVLMEKRLLTQSAHFNQFLQLYEQELGFTQHELKSSLVFSETLVSQMQEISVELEHLTSVQGVRTLGRKFCSDFEVMKREILNFQQEAQEELVLWTLRREATEEENKTLIATVQDLQSRNCILNGELDDRRNSIDYIAEELILKEQQLSHSLQMANTQLKAVEKERDKYQTDLVVLNEQLEMAQTLADERDIVSVEARQAAELSKRHAEEREEEARILERSVEELESTVFALESQLDIIKRESNRQLVAREVLEKELADLKHEMGLMQATIDCHESQTMRDCQDTEASKTELDRIVIEMKNQQIQARKSVESLQQECAEKDVQLRSCKAHIAELMLGAEKQASENHVKLKTLEAMAEHLKVDERKANVGGGSIGKAVEKSTGKVKGAGSPFKCMGSGLEKQRSSEVDEELSAARKRIKELEALAAARQKEIFVLNTKLAEAVSMTHDVVRDLLGVKMDIASYATLLNQQQVQRIAERARRRTVEAQEKEEELDTVREKLNVFIEERESWLEEINRRQAEAVAARVSAEKLRLRDQNLSTENERFREDCLALRKRVTDLEEEIKKLSGQQNLQQRIHHHAKIKEENNSIRLQNEDLSGKLRRMEILFTRVNDELARYRTADGKSAFLNFDEEARLQEKLQETEENRLQLAQTLIGLCTGVIQAAGMERVSRDLDPAAAMSALQHIQDRQETLERELSDYKLKARIAVEKRRLSDLRDLHTPGKNMSTITNFTASQQLPSPVSSSR